MIAELEKSFASADVDGRHDRRTAEYGWRLLRSEGTPRGLWITTVTHVHEHLGQLIAYALEQGHAALEQVLAILNAEF